MKKVYQRKRETRRDPILTTCRHFVHQLGIKATDPDLFDTLRKALEEKGLVLFIEQQTQGVHIQLLRKDRFNGVS